MEHRARVLHRRAAAGPLRRGGPAQNPTGIRDRAAGTQVGRQAKQQQPENTAPVLFPLASQILGREVFLSIAERAINHRGAFLGNVVLSETARLGSPGSRLPAVTSILNPVPELPGC